MQGNEIRKMTKDAIKSCRLKNVSGKFIESLTDFLHGIADESDRVRAIISRGEPKAEKLLKNFTHMTKS